MVHFCGAGYGRLAGRGGHVPAIPGVVLSGRAQVCVYVTAEHDCDCVDVRDGLPADLGFIPGLPYAAARDMEQRSRAGMAGGAAQQDGVEAGGGCAWLWPGPTGNSIGANGSASDGTRPELADGLVGGEPRPEPADGLAGREPRPEPAFASERLQPVLAHELAPSSQPSPSASVGGDSDNIAIEVAIGICPEERAG